MVICHPLRTLADSLETCNDHASLNNLCVSSKVWPKNLKEDEVAAVGRLQKVLRALPEDAQIYRTDAPSEMLSFLMGFIREAVHPKLRLQLCMLVSWRGYTMFEVTSDSRCGVVAGGSLR